MNVVKVIHNLSIETEICLHEMYYFFLTLTCTKGLFQQFLTTGNSCIPAAGLVPSIRDYTSDTGLFLSYKEQHCKRSSVYKKRRGRQRFQLPRHFPECLSMVLCIKVKPVQISLFFSLTTGTFHYISYYIIYQKLT